jgi:hypothetical protein
MRLQPMLGNEMSYVTSVGFPPTTSALAHLQSISAMTTTAKLTTQASKSPIAPSPPQSGTSHLASSRALIHRSISATPEPAAKSP